jgi:hypothetical protein
MRSFRFVAVFAMCVLALSLFANAKANKFGVADAHTLTITVPTRVGGVLLPKGDYKVLHTMAGQDHVMVFTQLTGNKAIETKVKCQLVPLKAKADHDEQTFELNAAKERVLHTLVFRGDTAQHVF